VNIDQFTPLIYLVVVAATAVGMHIVGVPEPLPALIVGAGLTRVKMGAPTKPEGEEK
jgi:hypothetical protein